jgi:uncharacterized protein
LAIANSLFLYVTIFSAEPVIFFPAGRLMGYKQLNAYKMKKNNHTSKALFGMLCLFAELSSLAQSPSANELFTSEDTVKSGYNGKLYHMYVSLPASYSINDTVHYPVLYVLDGKYSFNLFHTTRQIMDMGKEIEHVIIVAIGDDSKTYNEWLTNRHADFTPSHNAQNDSLFTKLLQLPAGSLRSGGADLFLKFLKHDLIPHINKKYKTNSDNSIYGHSLGGLFAGYCLLTDPYLFSRYSINSPSFWWNPQEIDSLIKQFTQAPLNRKTDIFISAGSLEGNMMIAPVNRFKEAIAASNNKNIAISSQVFENETHLSVVPACNSRTLKVLYGRKFNF